MRVEWWSGESGGVVEWWSLGLGCAHVGCLAAYLPEPELHLRLRCDQSDHAGEEELAHQVDGLHVPAALSVAVRERLDEPLRRLWAGRKG